MLPNLQNTTYKMTVANYSDTSSFQQPFISDPQSPQYVVVLPPYPHHHRHRLLSKSCRRRLYCVAISFLFLIAAAYLLWPSDPDLSIVRLRLDGLKFHSTLSLDVNLDLTVRVRNRDFYSIDYDSLKVSIGYRGNSLGLVTSDGGRIKAHGSSYVNATLQLDGVEILSDSILLIEDLAKGVITFDTVSEMSGKLRLFFFNLPIKTKISCEVIVNTRNQVISHQNCYPEMFGASCYSVSGKKQCDLRRFRCFYFIYPGLPLSS